MPSSCPATKENSLPVHAKELHLTVNITITITLTSCGGTQPYSISTRILTYPALLTNHGTQKTQNTTRLVNILPATALWRLYHFIRFSNEISRQVVLQETMESRIFRAHAKRQKKTLSPCHFHCATSDRERFPEELHCSRDYVIIVVMTSLFNIGARVFGSESTR